MHVPDPVEQGTLGPARAIPAIFYEAFGKENILNRQQLRRGSRLPKWLISGRGARDCARLRRAAAAVGPSRRQHVQQLRRGQSRLLAQTVCRWSRAGRIISGLLQPGFGFFRLDYNADRLEALASEREASGSASARPLSCRSTNSARRWAMARRGRPASCGGTTKWLGGSDPAGTR